MSQTPKAPPLPLEIKLILNGELPGADSIRLKSHVARYSGELCDDMGLSVGVSVSMSSAEPGISGHRGFRKLR